MKRRRKNKNKVNQHYFLKTIFVILLVLTTSFIYLIRPKFWDSKEKLIIATNGREGNITVSVIDPAEGSQTDILIPGTVQVQAAGELGTWKLSSLWQLGVNEKIDGDLLTRTIVKNFGFPVVSWRDEESQKTNLSLGDRLRLSIFELRIGKNSVSQIDLTKTYFLKKTRFLDGEWGYTIIGKPPLEVTAVFIDDEISMGNFKARIVNFSNNSALAERMGQVIEIMGVKVASIEKESAKDFDCHLSGSNDRLVKKFDLVFGCDNKSTREPGNFDVSLEIGKGFLRRF